VIRLLLVVLFVNNLFGMNQANAAPEVMVPRALYRPFFREKDEPDRILGPIWIDREPVTNQQYREFVKRNPEWRKSQVPKIFSAPTYLQSWRSDLEFPKGSSNHPVTEITWFAARKFCEEQGKRLPTVEEWEFSADGQNPKSIELILSWYGTSNKLSNVRSAPFNSLGVRGMHGLIWEWVEDFNSVIMAGDSRDSNDTSANLFCGAGALKAKDPAQYATFMRFAYRSSLKANYTGNVLGFRCVRTSL
jgi:formylglycine-generating enzyme